MQGSHREKSHAIKKKDPGDQSISYLVKVNKDGSVEKHHFNSKREALLFIKAMQDDARKEKQSKEILKKK